MRGGRGDRTLEAMTESTASTASFAPARLERPRDSAFQGVCTALARATGTEPVLWRVLTVVLTLFGGLGFVLYLGGIVAIPREDEEHSLLHRVIHGPERHFTRNQVLILVLTGVVFLGYVGDINHGVITGVLLVLAFLWWRQQAGTTARPTAATGADPSSLSGTPAATYAWTPPPPLPPKKRSPFGGVTFSAAVLVAGVLALIGATGTDMPVAVPIAAALAVVGVGLVAGSFYGSSWGLWWLAALLSVALGLAAAGQPLIDDGVGKRDWAPTGSAHYKLGAGKGVLDLASVRPDADVTAHVEYGQLLVLVPAKTAVSIDATNDFGDVELFGTHVEGRDKKQSVSDEGATVHLHLTVHAGEVKVVRS